MLIAILRAEGISCISQWLDVNVKNQGILCNFCNLYLPFFLIQFYVLKISRVAELIEAGIETIVDLVFNDSGLAGTSHII